MAYHRISAMLDAEAPHLSRECADALASRLRETACAAP